MIIQQIFGLLAIANGYKEKQESEKKEILQKIEEGWNSLPEEKFSCKENVLVATMMFKEHLKFKDFEKARYWADLIINDDNRPDTGEKELLRGKIYYEKGDFESAKEQFAIAMKKSDGREFEGEDKKYLALLKK